MHKVKKMYVQKQVLTIICEHFMRTLNAIFTAEI